MDKRIEIWSDKYQMLTINNATRVSFSPLFIGLCKMSPLPFIVSLLSNTSPDDEAAKWEVNKISTTAVKSLHETYTK